MRLDGLRIGHIGAHRNRAHAKLDHVRGDAFRFRLRFGIVHDNVHTLQCERAADALPEPAAAAGYDRGTSFEFHR
jgi:hypothetical protein